MYVITETAIRHTRQVMYDVMNDSVVDYSNNDGVLGAYVSIEHG
jgi:hypothetical protein